jgi:choline dehydrogenase
MRSGIGDAAALTALGIAVLHDAQAVGRHFMDHPILRASLALKPGFRAEGADARHTNCCLTYSSKLGGGGERDMIIIAYNHRGLAESGVAPNGGIGVALYDALSRGEVRLTSADPDEQPVVEENMLDHPADRLRMRDGVRRLAKLCTLSPIADITEAITFGESALSMPEAAALSDDALDALMLAEAGDIQHAAGTCRMTAYEDPRGVVDPDLKVRGVEGLRVADASIMPSDCRANLHFTCVMIGEAAARRMRAAG